MSGLLDRGITIGFISDVFVRIKPEDDEEPLAPLHILDNKFDGCFRCSDAKVLALLWVSIKSSC